MMIQKIHNFFYGENSREANRHLHLLQLSTFKRAQLAASVLVNPDRTRVWGIDISHWDGNVDLVVSKSLGASFVFIKGLDGTVRTRFFVENRARAVEAGLLQAPYAWLYRDANVRCVSQAQAAHSLLEQYPADLPLMLDFEWTRYGGVYSNPTYSDLDKWVTEFLRLGNRKPVLYSAAGYMNPLGAMPTTLRQKFSGFCFANYGVLSPTLPSGFTDWDFWQFSATGDASYWAPNDSGKLELDLDYWSGDLAELYAFAGETVPPTGEPMYYKVITTTLNIREGAGIGYRDIGDLLIGDIVETVEPMVNSWIHIKSVTRNGQPVVLPSANNSWCSGGNAYVQPYTPAPAPTLPDLPVSITLGDDVTYAKQTVNVVLKAK